MEGRAGTAGKIQHKLGALPVKRSHLPALDGGSAAFRLLAGNEKRLINSKVFKHPTRIRISPGFEMVSTSFCGVCSNGIVE
jgi:hypothetical protein